jgi:hypothetical protein
MKAVSCCVCSDGQAGLRPMQHRHESAEQMRQPGGEDSLLVLAPSMTRTHMRHSAAECDHVAVARLLLRKPDQKRG